MSTNGKVNDLLIIMLITVRLLPQQQGRFLPQIPYFYIFFRYLKTFAFIIVGETFDCKDLICNWMSEPPWVPVRAQYYIRMRRQVIEFR